MTKYNSQKVFVDGHYFDSQVEAKYYLHLCELKERGEIEGFIIQPKFVLQQGFVDSQGKKHRPVTYIADFQIFHNDGETEVIDIKGLATTVANLKRNLFQFRYPDLTLKWICYVKNFGGWVNYDENQKRIKENKKQKKLKIIQN